MRLTTHTEKHMQRIKRLYKNAFPRNERIPFFIMKHMTKKGEVQFFAIESNNGKFGGFAVTMRRDDIIMLSYFAVHPKLRNRGIGSKALKALMKRFSEHRFILEIEDAKEPCSERPLGFIPNGGADMKDLELSERLAGFAFPEDLKRFLVEQNGAVPETLQNRIILPSVKEKLGVRFLYGITQVKGVGDDHFIPHELKERRMFIPEQMIPVAGELKGRCWICYSNMEKYKGVYAVDRMLKLKESKRDSCIYKIADTFTEFLTKIVADE